MAGFTKDLEDLLRKLGGAEQFLGKLENRMNTLASAAGRLSQSVGNMPGAPSQSGGHAGSSGFNQKASKDFLSSHNPEYVGAMTQFQDVGFRPGWTNNNFALNAKGDLLRQSDKGLESTGYSVGKFVQAQTNQKNFISKFLGNDQEITGNGYRETDIVKFNQAAQKNAKLSESLAKQSQMFASGAQPESAKIIEALGQRLTEQQGNYKSALQNYTTSLAGGDQVKLTAAIEQLTKTMAQLDRTTNDAVEITKQGGPKIGGVQGIINTIKANPVGAAVAAVGVGLEAYQAFTRASIAVDQANLAGESRAYVNQAAVRGGQLSRQFDYYNISSGESLVRNRGDIMFGGQIGRFLGQGGFANAQAQAKRDEENRLDIVRREKFSGILGGVISNTAGGAAAGAIGGSALGLGALATGALGAIGGLGKGLLGSVDTYVSNEATQVDGGLFINKSTQDAARAQIELNVSKRAEALRAGAMDNARRLTIGTQGIMDMYSAQQEGALTVGQYTLTKDRMMALATAGGAKYTNPGMPPSVNKVAAQAANNAAGLEIATGNEMGSGDASRVGRTSVDPTYRADQINNTVDNSADDATFNRDLARSTLFSENQIGYTEFAQKYNTLQNVVGRSSSQQDLKERNGSGPTTLENETVGLVKLERTGLGSFQENAANMASLNKINGNSDNYKALENILGNAVAVGFDKSRMSQAFVRSTTELAQAVGATNTDYISGAVATQSQMLSNNGQANEQSLDSARKAIGNYAEATSKNDVVGISKTLGAMNAGAGIGTGIGIISNMNSVQAMAAIKELKSRNVTSPEVQALLNVVGRGDPSLDHNGAINKTVSELSAAVHYGNQAILGQAFANNDKVRKATESLHGFKGKTKKEQKKIADDLRADMTEAEDTMHVGRGVLYTAAVNEAVLNGDISQGYGKSLLHKAEEKGRALAVDPVKKQMQSFIDSAVNETAGKAKGVTMSEYLSTAITGVKEEKFADGTNIDSNKLKAIQDKMSKNQTLTKDESDYYAKSDKALEGVDRIERARSAAVAKSETSTSQRVVVENWDEFLTKLKPTQHERDSTGRGLVPIP